MLVIPAINCNNVECVEARMKVASQFLGQGGWVHIDVADARFTFNKTWGTPSDLKRIRAMYPAIHIELHLMVEEPEKIVQEWLDVGAERIIFHIETIHSFDAAERIIASCKAVGVGTMISLCPETPVNEILSYADKIEWVQILAVIPGLSGQPFQGSTLDKVRVLRERLPHIKIEVDGGIDYETAKKVHDAGADAVAAASCIFGSKDPALAYSRLAAID